MTKEILLIEDDENDLEIFIQALRAVDKTVRCNTVKELTEAAKFLKGKTPEYIFIDFDMPEIKNSAFFFELKKIKPEKSRIIFYSDKAQEDWRKTDLKEFHFFKKPRMINVLARKLDDILNDN